MAPAPWLLGHVGDDTEEFFPGVEACPRHGQEVPRRAKNQADGDDRQPTRPGPRLLWDSPGPHQDKQQQFGEDQEALQFLGDKVPQALIPLQDDQPMASTPGARRWAQSPWPGRRSR